MAGDDAVGDAAQDPQLGAALVVLGQPRDPLEERGAALVVEVLGRQRLRRGGEPGEGVVGEAPPGAAGVDVQPEGPGEQLDGGAHAASRANRSPEKIWRRWGRSQLRNVTRAAIGWVAHEPPRSTR